MADSKNNLKDAESLVDIHRELQKMFKEENYTLEEQLASVKALNSFESKIAKITRERTKETGRMYDLQSRISKNMKQVQTLLADRSGVDRHAEIAKIVKSIRRDALEKSKIEKDSEQTQLAINKLGLSKAVALTKEMQQLWSDNNAKSTSYRW